MIRAQNLSKYFGGKRALGPVSFEIEDGETVGFLGLNGAGKTTALRIFACDLKPSSGTVSVGNVDAIENPHGARSKIGFLPESPPLYQDMVVSEYLAFAGKLRGMSSAELKKRIPEVVELTHLSDVQNDVIRHLSHGYRQRVGVGQAIIHRPELLILDEPTRGLDPVQIVEMRNMITDLKDNYTVLISSHILTEISKTCDRLLVLGHGKIIASGTEESLSSSLREVSAVSVAVRAKAEDDAEDRGRSDAEACLSEVEGVSEVSLIRSERDELSFNIDCDRDVRPDTVRALVGKGFDVLQIDRAQRELENVFLKLVKGDENASN